ncbi:MAG: response regulator [Candidatus Riflebacteria bacterium]|nr:response regulator [Candidatus Riflebacteria bacterium]
MNRLLIVDDNQQNLYMLQMLLSNKGIQVESASNGTEALESARRDPPDMIISDILMPGMDGYALCRVWKEDKRLKNIPFVFYTATYTDPKDEDFALSLGADRFIIKPVEPEKLLSLLLETRNNFKTGKPVAAPKPAEKDEFYVGYNSVLVRKLEDKMLQLEEANRILEQDIAERKLAENERQKLQEQLIQAQKMEAIGRMAGGIAHDFNNMLGVILGCAELALLWANPTDKIYALIKEIRVAAHRSGELTRQLLAFARKQPVDRKVLNLNEAIAGMLKILHRLAGENIELILRSGADLWPVRMDPSQVDQILTNLCANARDAIAGKGQVVIETNNVVLDATSSRQPEGIIPGEYVRLSVRDTGCGMAKEALSHLFEPFFTTKEIKGTGLGLATVYGVVKQNDGYISVISDSDKGTTFEIYLPRHTGITKKDSTPVPEASVTHGQKTVLLVKDEPQLVNLTRMMLESMEYQVLSAVTPDEAILLAETHGGEIHLLITDMVLPEMKGRDLFKQIKNRHSQVRLLFMSGYTSDVSDTKGLLEDGEIFLQNPFSMDDLATKVSEVLKKPTMS